jgi:hypothetical protein
MAKAEGGNVSMPAGTDKIDYRYLNLDTERFVDSLEELEKQIGKGYLRDIPNHQQGQWLFAASRQPFSPLSAIITCRRISFSSEQVAM